MTFGYYLNTSGNQPAQPTAAGVPPGGGPSGNANLAAALRAMTRQQQTSGGGGGPADAGAGGGGDPAGPVTPGPAPAAGNNQLGQVLRDLLRQRQQQQQRTETSAAGDSETWTAGEGAPAGGRGSRAMRTIGRTAGAIGLLGIVAAVLNNRFNRMADSALRVNASLGDFAGGIALANARAEAAGIRRSIRQGEGISQGFSRLSQTQSDYRDLTTELLTPLQNLGMNVMSSLGNFRNVMLDQVAGPVIRGLNVIVEKINEKFPNPAGDDLIDARAFLSDISDGKMDGHGTTYFNPANTPVMTPADRQRIFGGGNRP